MRHDDDEDEVEGVEGDGAERTMEMETDAATAIETDPPMERDVRDGGDAARDDDEVNDDDGGGVVDAISAEVADGDALGVGADPRSNRGLRRAAEAAERERRTLESRRRKLGIATGGGRGREGEGKRVVAAGHGLASLRSTHPASGVGCSPRWASRGRARAWGKGGRASRSPSRPRYARDAWDWAPRDGDATNGDGRTTNEPRRRCLRLRLVIKHASRRDERAKANVVYGTRRRTSFGSEPARVWRPSRVKEISSSASGGTEGWFSRALPRGMRG